jgi:hypothetical protein
MGCRRRGLNLATSFGASAIFLAQLYTARGDSRLLLYVLVFGAAALFSLGYFLWSRRVPIRDVRPMPRLVRMSFLVFSLTLVLVAIALILRAPVVFPWRLNPDSSVLFGWVFMGAAVYFLYGLTRPRWHDARGQLLGFLAYDLILIFPLPRPLRQRTAGPPAQPDSVHRGAGLQRRTRHLLPLCPPDHPLLGRAGRSRRALLAAESG